MDRMEAKKELEEMNTYKPRSVKGRRKQAAIDLAIATIDAYENLLKLITKDKRPNICFNCDQCCFCSVNSKGEVTIKCRLGSGKNCKEAT